MSKKPPEALPSGTGSSYQWVILAACFIVVTITNGAGLTFGVFLNPFRESFAASSATVSGAYSITLWMFAFCGVLSGWAVDNYGPRITIMLGACILSLGYLLSSFADSLWHLYFTGAFIGIGLSGGYVPTMTTITRTFEKRRGFALGLNSAGIGLGPLMMAPIETRLILLRGWRFAYRVTACIVGVSIPVAMLLRIHPAGKSKERKSASRRQPGSSIPFLTEWTGSGSVVKQRVFWLFCLVFLAIGVSIQTVMAHIVAYSQNQGETPMIAAAVLSTVAGTSMAGRIVMGSASDWIGRRKALVICTFFEGTMLLWLLTTSSTISLFIFSIIFGFFYGGHAPQLPALIGENLGFERMGANLGVINLFWGIGSAFGPFVTGYLFDMTGSYSGGFLIAMCLMYLSSAASFFLRSPKKTSF